MGAKVAGLGHSQRDPAKSKRIVTRAALLWVLLTLFVFRVIGQLLVVNDLAPFLPPMDAWQSGLLPYPLLLASQILIVGVLATVCIQFSRRRGYFVRRHAWLATPLWVLGWIYAVGMVVRYALLRRDLIPVTLHVVLAMFLLVVAQYQRSFFSSPFALRNHGRSRRRM